MITGIIGAMEEEVEILKSKMKVSEIVKKAAMEFYKGYLNDKQVVIVRSGIGKVNAGICTQILIDEFNVNRVINTGIAGSLHNSINIGDMVISTEVLQHDVDATGFGYQLGEIPRMGTLTFEADFHMVEVARETCEKVNSEIQVFVGRIVSGDQFVSDKELKNKISNNFGGYCTEMEGAAIGQAAYLNNIPFVIIRAISDKADDSATMDYPTFEKQAIAHSVKLVEQMLLNL